MRPGDSFRITPIRVQSRSTLRADINYVIVAPSASILPQCLLLRTQSRRCYLLWESLFRSLSSCEYLAFVFCALCHTPTRRIVDDRQDYITLSQFPYCYRWCWITETQAKLSAGGSPIPFQLYGVVEDVQLHSEGTERISVWPLRVPDSRAAARMLSSNIIPGEPSSTAVAIYTHILIILQVYRYPQLHCCSRLMMTHLMRYVIAWYIPGFVNSLHSSTGVRKASYSPRLPGQGTYGRQRN